MTASGTALPSVLRAAAPAAALLGLAGTGSGAQADDVKAGDVKAGDVKAGDVKAGRHKALQCQTCHGLDGVAKLPEAPDLAGQNETYLAKALPDYRSGARKNDAMSIVAPTLKDQDIADLAAYFAAIEITVGPPPK